MSNPTDTPNRVRTSDAEREQVVTVLRQAIVDGRLSMTEGDQRIAAAYEAKFRDELTPLTRDLPGSARDPLGDSLRSEMRGGRGGHPGHEGWHGHHGRPRFPFFFLILLTFLIIGAVTGSFHFFWIIPVAFLTLFVARRIFFRRNGYGRWRGRG